MGETNEQPARCVVWSGRPGAPDARLGEALRRRGLVPMQTVSIHRALAELCRAHRAVRKPGLILAGVADPSRMLAAVERFAPTTSVWVYEESANPPLRPLVSPPRVIQVPQDREPVSVPGPTPEPTPGRVESGGFRSPPDPGLKIAPGPTDPAKPDRPISARDVLDDEELEMLLASERAMEDDAR